MTAGFRIEKLRRDHPVDGFSCGREELDRFLIRYAFGNQQANASQTWLGLHDAAVIGFCSLVVGEVAYGGHSVGCQIDNAMRERSGNGPCVAPLRRWGLSGRPPPAAAAPRSPLLPCRPGVLHAACRCGAN